MAKVKQKAKTARRKVTFRYHSKSAKTVSLLGDFNKWDCNKHPMKNNGNGIWSRTIMIQPGKYEYKFLDDGEWKVDPQNDQYCLNCFGTYNHMLYVAAK